MHPHRSFCLFWKHSKFQVAEADEQGCSWLELFARFQYLGGKLLPEDPKTTIVCNFKKLLSLFQARTRSLFRQQGSDALCEHLKPARVSKARLADYGIHSYVPCLHLMLCLEPAAAQAMHAMLLTLRAPGKKSSCKTATLKSFRLPAVPPGPNLWVNPFLSS